MLPKLKLCINPVLQAENHTTADRNNNKRRYIKSGMFRKSDDGNFLYSSSQRKRGARD